MSDNIMEMNAIKDFLDTVEVGPLELSDAESEFTNALTSPTFDKPGAQSVVVGSQMSGFATEVPAHMRPIISNGFLLAQLAADKKTKGDNTGGPGWYHHYLSTLTKLGWAVTAQSNANRIVEGSSLEVHKAIIPVITAALGPAATVSSTIIGVLKGLDEIDKDQPWITLFDHRSQRASVNQFQISQTIMDGSIPTVTLVAFELNASRSITQVLFFKFSQDDATLNHFEQKMNINPFVLENSGAQLAAIVSDHISQNIAALESLEI